MVELNGTVVSDYNPDCVFSVRLAQALRCVRDGVERGNVVSCSTRAEFKTFTVRFSQRREQQHTWGIRGIAVPFLFIREERS
jgi:hypothetical protein